jgi:hypothetical protein
MNMPCSSCLFEVVIGSRWKVEGWARGLNLKWGGRAHTDWRFSVLPPLEPELLCGRSEAGW